MKSYNYNNYMLYNEKLKIFISFNNYLFLTTEKNVHINYLYIIFSFWEKKKVLLGRQTRQVIIEINVKPGSHVAIDDIKLEDCLPGK